MGSCIHAAKNHYGREQPYPITRFWCLLVQYIQIFRKSQEFSVNKVTLFVTLTTPASKAHYISLLPPLQDNGMSHILRAHHLPGTEPLIWSGIVDIFKVFHGNLRAAEEVNPFLSVFFVFAGGGDNPTVEPDIGAFFWYDILQVLIFIFADGGFPRVDNANRCLFANHHIPYFVGGVF